MQQSDQIKAVLVYHVLISERSLKAASIISYRYLAEIKDLEISEVVC